MKMFLKVLFWTVWITILMLCHICFTDKEMVGIGIIAVATWWVLTIPIIIVKYIKYRKENHPLSKEVKKNYKEVNKKIKYRNSTEYKEKYLSEVEIENSYFGKGILLKDAGNPENIIYKDVKKGFEKMFTSFGREANTPYDLYEFLVKEDNINYVISSLEKIYVNSKELMKKCYGEIYDKITEFFNDAPSSLKNDFSIDFLKENWHVLGMQVYDDLVRFQIGIDAAENHEDDSNYDIIISVDYNKQEPEVIFDVVW